VSLRKKCYEISGKILKNMKIFLANYFYHQKYIRHIFTDVLLQKRPSADNQASVEANRNVHEMQLKPSLAQRDCSSRLTEQCLVTVVNERKEESHAESQLHASSSKSPPRGNHHPIT